MRSVEWLAGILEGEGYFSKMKSGSSGNYTTPVVAVTMTDGDVIHEVQTLFEYMGQRHINICEKQLPSGKIGHSLWLTGLPAVRIMHAVLPFMGYRRSLAIKQVIQSWNPIKYKEAVAYKQQISGVA